MKRSRTSTSCPTRTRVCRPKAPSCCRPSPTAANCGSPAVAPPPAPRPPRKARSRARRVAVSYTGRFFQQAPIDASLFGAEDRFVDVAPVPGTHAAWVADQPYAQRGSSTAKAKVALIGADGADHARHPARQRRRARQRPAGRGHRPRRSLAGDLRGLAVSLHERDRPARRHRPQLGRHDHPAPERVGRPVRPRRASAR